MPKLDNLKIVMREPVDYFQSYSIVADQGYINTRLLFEKNLYKIAMYKVNHKVRRLGYGRELLYVARDHARVLGASAIVAHIVSRESVHAMTAVFGDESVMVQDLGNYAPEGYDYATHGPITRASLNYLLA